jgi:hypothetical protein
MTLAMFTVGFILGAVTSWSVTLFTGETMKSKPKPKPSKPEKHKEKRGC